MNSNLLKVYYLPIYLSITLIAGIYLGKNIFSTSQSFNQFSSNDSLYNEASNLAEILQIVQDNYVDSVNVKDVAGKGLSDLLHRLDPHSNYIPASKVAKTNESLEGSFEGIGLEFLLMGDTIVAVKTVANGPSHKAGILPGDKILFIENQNAVIKDIKSEDVINKLRGKRGSTVNIKIQRHGSSTLIPLSIKRAEIPIYSVHAAFMLDSSTAYFKIDEFSSTTMDEFKASYPYQNEKVKTVVIDLRGNGGGYLNTCTQLADEFLKEEELIVYTKGRTQGERKMYATSQGRFEDVRLYVLIDHQSASASEIFAGAMQDNDRATIIGTRSFGKGLVQEMFTLSDGAQVRLTISRYYTPSGRCIQKPYKDMDYEDYTLSSFDNDSIADSTVYFTKNKRKVYGGGGIFPDIKINEDSTISWKELGYIYRNDIIRKTAIRFVIQHLGTLSKLGLEEFKNNKIYNAQLNNMVQKLNVSPFAKEYILKEVKANVVRSIWGNNAYYSLKLQGDEWLKKVKK